MTGGVRRVRDWGGAAVVVAALAVGVTGCASPSATDIGPLVEWSPPPAIADEWSFAVDGKADAAVAPAPFELEYLGPQCGDTWVLTPGVTVHDPERAPDVSGTLDATAWIVTDNLEAMSPTEVWAGYYTLHSGFVVSYRQATQLYRWWVVPVLVKDGTVSAVGSQVGGSGGTAGEEASIAFESVGLLPGQCSDENRPTSDDGDYEVFWVAQAVADAGGSPILTVSMPFETNPVEFYDLEAWWDATARGATAAPATATS